jgi:hypothetical protein
MKRNHEPACEHNAITDRRQCRTRLRSGTQRLSARRARSRANTNAAVADCPACSHHQAIAMPRNGRFSSERFLHGRARPRPRRRSPFRESRATGGTSAAPSYPAPRARHSQYDPSFRYVSRRLRAVARARMRREIAMISGLAQVGHPNSRSVLHRPVRSCRGSVDLRRSGARGALLVGARPPRAALHELRARLASEGWGPRRTGRAARA